MKATCPLENLNASKTEDGSYRVASAEQSFIDLMLSDALAADTDYITVGDCYRPLGSIGNKRRIRNLCENRYYHDPDRNISVTYIQAFSDFTAQRGHLNASTAIPTKSPALPPLRENAPYLWEYDTWDKTVRFYMSQLNPKPKAAVINAAAWGNQWLLKEENHEPIAKAFQDVGIQGIWKTASAARKGRIDPELLPVGNIMCRVLGG